MRCWNYVFWKSGDVPTWRTSITVELQLVNVLWNARKCAWRLMKSDNFIGSCLAFSQIFHIRPPHPIPKHSLTSHWSPYQTINASGSHEWSIRLRLKIEFILLLSYEKCVLLNVQPIAEQLCAALIRKSKHVDKNLCGYSVDVSQNHLSNSSEYFQQIVAAR